VHVEKALPYDFGMGLFMSNIYCGYVDISGRIPECRLIAADINTRKIKKRE